MDLPDSSYGTPEGALSALQAESDSSDGNVEAGPSISRAIYERGSYSSMTVHSYRSDVYGDALDNISPESEMLELDAPDFNIQPIHTAEGSQVITEGGAVNVVAGRNFGFLDTFLTYTARQFLSVYRTDMEVRFTDVAFIDTDNTMSIESASALFLGDKSMTSSPEVFMKKVETLIRMNYLPGLTVESSLAEVLRYAFGYRIRIAHMFVCSIEAPLPVQKMFLHSLLSTKAAYGREIFTKLGHIQMGQYLSNRTDTLRISSSNIHMSLHNIATYFLGRDYARKYSSPISLTKLFVGMFLTFLVTSIPLVVTNYHQLLENRLLASSHNVMANDSSHAFSMISRQVHDLHSAHNDGMSLVQELSNKVDYDIQLDNVTYVNVPTLTVTQSHTVTHEVYSTHVGYVPTTVHATFVGKETTVVDLPTSVAATVVETSVSVSVQTEIDTLAAIGERLDERSQIILIIVLGSISIFGIVFFCFIFLIRCCRRESVRTTDRLPTYRI